MTFLLPFVDENPFRAGKTKSPVAFDLESSSPSSLFPSSSFSSSPLCFLVFVFVCNLCLNWSRICADLRDKVSWNAVLTGYARRDQSEEAMTSFSEMQWETKPCKFTFETLFGSIGALVEVYTKCRCLEYAIRVFKESSSLDVSCPQVQEIWQLTSFYDTWLHAPGNELWDVFDYLKNYLICAGPAAVGYDLCWAYSFAPQASPNDIAGMVNWKLPLEGWFKLSVDVAVDATRGLFGPGVVVYNYLGKVMCQEFINVIMWMMLILVRLRLETFHFGLQLATEIDLSPLLVYLDSFMCY
ncbi:hypothetical protein WN943_021201 [Citrus x changshan-huyou]